MSTTAPTRHSLRLVAVTSLVLMAILWGSTFFSIKALITHIPVPDMLAIRFTISTLVLGVVGWRSWRMSRRTLLHGAVLGLLFGAAQLLQTFGMATVSASASGFITGLYVVATPILAAVILRERIPLLTWAAVALALAGLGVLSLNLSGGIPIGIGEVLVFGSALLYAGHIVAADSFSTGTEAMSLVLIQSAVMTAMCWAAALPDGISGPTSVGDWLWILYLAILAGALTLFLQIWAQAHVPATPAAVIMSTEPVWAAVFAVALGGEQLTWRMLLGGSSIFAAMVMVIVLPALQRRRRPAA